MNVWIVRVADRERGFQTKREAIAWLQQLTHDARRRPTIVKTARGSYTYIGPADVVARRSLFRVIASIDLVDLPTQFAFTLSAADRHDQFFTNQLLHFRPKGRSR